jgi:hypothetical protein
MNVASANRVNIRSITFLFMNIFTYKSARVKETEMMYGRIGNISIK